LKDLFPNGIYSTFKMHNVEVTRKYDKGLLPSRDIKSGQLCEQLTKTRPHYQTLLNNGMNVVSEIFPSNHKMTTVGVIIKAGTRNETSENNGVAHFLEHLHFKGTERRSRIELEKEVENKGAHFNA